MTGSLTVEATLALTVFLFFWTALLCLFPAMQLHLELRNAMEQTAEETAMLAYALREGDTVGSLSEASEASALQALAENSGAALYYYSRIVSLMGRERLQKAGISGGCGGLSFWGSTLPEEGQPDVKIVLSYRQEIPFFPLLTIPVCQQVCQRAWVGNLDSGASKAELDPSTPVFIAENGEVYHLSESCSHLLLTVCRVNAEEVADLRNSDRGRYYPCELCMKGEAHGEVYITEDGDRYHADRNCSGLKRTVRESTLGETTLPPCSRCAQGGE